MEKRDELLKAIFDAQDETYNLMTSFDTQFHRYGEIVIYEAEANIIDLIGAQPGITVTELANLLRRTPSACSQIVRKLRNKGWVEQKRNPRNNRIYNLILTDNGKQLYENYQSYLREYRIRASRYLAEFTEQELEDQLRVQRKLNKSYESYMKDVEQGCFDGKTEK